jgi:hypothetical protein
MDALSAPGLKKKKSQGVLAFYLNLRSWNELFLFYFLRGWWHFTCFSLYFGHGYGWKIKIDDFFT